MTDGPFTLPPGKVLISFSGGRTSAMMLFKIAEANGGLPHRARVCFANTGREFEETLRFVEDVGRHCGVNIDWLEDAPRDGGALFKRVSLASAARDGAPFADMITRKRALPDVSKRFCTTELKVLPVRRWLLSLGWKEWNNALGIRADEGNRVKPSKDARVSSWFPMVAADLTRHDVSEFWRRQSFDLELPKGFSNCDGCFLKSEASLTGLARHDVNRHLWWEEQERRIGHTFSKRYARKDLRQFAERQFTLLSDNALLCQKSDGECMT